MNILNKTTIKVDVMKGNGIAICISYLSLCITCICDYKSKTIDIYINNLNVSGIFHERQHKVIDIRALSSTLSHHKALNAMYNYDFNKLLYFHYNYVYYVPHKSSVSF